MPRAHYAPGLQDRDRGLEAVDHHRRIGGRSRCHNCSDKLRY